MFSTFDRELLATYLRPQRPRLVLLSACLAATIGGQLANPALAGTFIDQAKAGAPFDRLLHLAIAFTVVAA